LARTTAGLTKIRDLHVRLRCAKLILPGLFAAPADGDWMDRQLAWQDEAESLGIDLGQTLVAVALCSDTVKNNDQVHEILDASNRWRGRGVYLVCEHPAGSYLVDDPTWLANVLDPTAGFRLKGKEVVIGYCNHQMLIAACAAATAIASGTWMNVRSFPPEKFRRQYDEEIKKRRTWYYCPHALSEYRIPFLDVAKQQGVLDNMQTDPALGSTHADILFAGPQPSTVTSTEQSAFRHYLRCLRSQTAAARRPSFDATVTAHRQALDAAEALLTQLRAVGVTGGQRDFQDMLDANRAALALLTTNRGAILRRRWATL
jgi:hypothetical protein